MKNLFIFSVLVFAVTGFASSVLRVPIKGIIHQGTTDVFKQAIATASKENDELILFVLDTPGGMLDATRDIVQLMMSSPIPIAVYVAPSGAHAGSAGTFITMAAHVAAMAPGTNIGAAHPVMSSGEDPEKAGGKHLAQKVENDTIAFVEGIAKQRGRNVDWAKKSVLSSESIDDEQALKLKVIDVIAKSESDLLKTIDQKNIQLSQKRMTLNTAGATIKDLQLPWLLKLKIWLANPTIMYVLIVLAGLGIYFEFSHPGMILPGFVGVSAAILVMFANSLIPMSAVGLLLIVMAFVMFVAEIYVSSFGLLALGGIISLIVGSYMLFGEGLDGIQVPRGLIWGAAAGVGTVATVIAVAVGRLFQLKPTTGGDGMVGQKAQVVDAISTDRAGKVFVWGEYWNAVSSQPLEPGRTVVVVKVEGLIAHVEPE